MHIERRKRKIPTLTTAALPDLIFTVLFFFMLVTHLRKQEVSVEYQLPQGTTLTSGTRNDNTLYIYIGNNGTAGSPAEVQIADKRVSQKDIFFAIAKEASQLRATHSAPPLAVLSADVHTKMGEINDIKLLLTSNGIDRIRYVATRRPRPFTEPTTLTR